MTRIQYENVQTLRHLREKTADMAESIISETSNRRKEQRSLEIRVRGLEKDLEETLKRLTLEEEAQEMEIKMSRDKQDSLEERLKILEHQHEKYQATNWLRVSLTIRPD